MPEGDWFDYLLMFGEALLIAFGPYLLILAGLVWLALRHFG